MEQQQQAPANPAQRSVPEEESSGSSMQASRQSEHRSFAVAGDEQAEQSVAADLMQEAAEATHQVVCGLQHEDIAARTACANHVLLCLCRPCACAGHVLVQAMCLCRPCACADHVQLL